MCRHFAESCRTFEVLRLLGEKPTSFFSLQMDANGNVLEAARSCGARGGGDRHRRLAPQLELARDQLQIFAIGKNVASIQPITSPVKFARSSGEASPMSKEWSEYCIEFCPQTSRGSFSAVSTPIFASKYALESSRRDLRNALLCTVLVGSVWEFFRQKSPIFFAIELMNIQ